MRIRPIQCTFCAKILAWETEPVSGCADALNYLLCHNCAQNHLMIATDCLRIPNSMEPEEVEGIWNALWPERWANNYATRSGYIANELYTRWPVKLSPRYEDTPVTRREYWEAIHSAKRKREKGDTKHEN